MEHWNRAWKSSAVHLWLRPGRHFTALPIKKPRPSRLLLLALTRHTNSAACGPPDMLSPRVCVPEQLMGASQPLLTITGGHFNYLLTCFILRTANWCRKLWQKRRAKPYLGVQLLTWPKINPPKGQVHTTAPTAIWGWMEEGKQIKPIKPKTKKEKLSLGRRPHSSIACPGQSHTHPPTEQTCALLSRKQQQKPYASCCNLNGDVIIKPQIKGSKGSWPNARESHGSW